MKERQLSASASEQDLRWSCHIKMEGVWLIVYNALDTGEFDDSALQGPKVKLPRCAATLLLSLPGRSFLCRLCKRSYNQVPSSSLAACIFCGTRLSAPHPETTVAGPGWPH